VVPRRGRPGIGRVVVTGLVVLILIAATLGAVVLTAGRGAKSSTSAESSTTSPTQSASECDARITAETTLNENIGPCPGDGLVIGANGITLDCAGHTINGTGTNDTSAGIRLTGMSGITVENCYVTEFWYGLVLDNSSNNSFVRNMADKNVYDGFLLYSSSDGNVLSGNTANDNVLGDGFYIGNSSSDALIGNTADSNHYSGFVLDGSSRNALTNNTANDNHFEYGFYLYNSSRNSLIRNKAVENRAYGYFDNSVGSDKAGTANMYGDDTSIDNGAGGSKPRGLATPQL